MPGARSSGDTAGPEGVWQLATSVTAAGEKEYLFNRARALEIWVDDVFNAADAYREITSSCAEPRSKYTRPDLEELPVAATDTADQLRKKKYCRNYQFGFCSQGNKCPYVHELNICKHYFKHGNCRLRECERLHYLPRFAIERGIKIAGIE